MPSRSAVVVALLAASIGFVCPPASAIGRLVDVAIVDRATGETLTPIEHGGAWYVAGRPGARYGVVLASRAGRRLLNVVSVDGVNAISGETAGWDQTGYVLWPYQRTEVDGWRKSSEQVAAFEFTALPDAYAARTGRPANVGVIGIAVFDERPAPAVARRRPPGGRGAPESDGSALPGPAPEDAARRAGPSQAPVGKPGAGVDAKDDASAADARAPVAAATPPRAERLGTGHGALEASSVTFVPFERAHATPDDLIVIRYDRLENLIASGIVPRPPTTPIAAADPFPDSRRFVPDPPPRR